MKFITNYGLILLFSFFIFCFSSCNSFKTPGEINTDLEKIENEIYVLISEGKKSEAIKLVGKLTHPSGLISDHEIKNSGKFGFANEKYTYNEYWNKRKEELRLEINKMGENKLVPNFPLILNSKPESNSASPSMTFRKPLRLTISAWITLTMA